ncbi:MAG TPA: DUF1329 domain-containing protein [Alphaproteobacteria bacterium]|nr:DUF1329 domain-containing protein [Alphaproteobacteria bacterium]HAJ47590.1 DUF1329 domain-containing protein [Alphaproteobacteria bacterium]
MKTSLYLTASALALGLTVGVATAKVPQDQANRLGADLTPWGAEKGGGDGVPAWDGGLTAPPSGVSFDAKKQQHPNPFKGDAVQLTITPGNAGQHGDKLTEGHKALLKTYGTYKMNVYQSRRTCSAPQFVYAASKNNALVGDLTADGDGVTGAIMGTAFPVFNNAMELVWNSKLRFRNHKVTRQFAAAPVQNNGSFNLIIVQDEAILRWSDPAKKKAEDLDNISLYYIANTVSPARLAGNVVLVHESIDAVKDPRKAWSYNPGTRRVRVAPDISYDNPGTNTDGMTTSDAFDGFNGAMDRYHWRFLGRSVKYIPYNNYDAINAKLDDIIKPQHLNQDYMRYEPHRVWSAEAYLKPGVRHLYARRVMHFDEDSFTLSVSEIYDGRGQLYRVQELQTANYYHVPLCGAAGEIIYDITAGRYLAQSMRNEQPPVNYFADELSDSRYTPEAIRSLGVR